MSVDTSSAIELITQPVIVAAAGAAVVVLAIAVAIIRKRRARKRVTAAWQRAADELGIELVTKGSKLGPIARGNVNDHLVTIAPVPGNRGSKRRPATLYSVEYAGAEAPEFRLTKRRAGSGPVVSTGHRTFDHAVSVRTEDVQLLTRFVTKPRRTIILGLLKQWPTMEISNQRSQLKTSGIEMDLETFVDTVCHLVAVAETIDRPTVVVDPRTVVGNHEMAVGSASAITSVAPPAHPEPRAGGVFVDVRLDEQSVIRELFDSGLVGAEITTRFEQFYRGHQVSWAGEIVRVGGVEGSGERRVAALIGSADGVDASSGRVVAVTTVGAEPALVQGDVVTFTGSLVNLDADQRLFHLL